MADPTPPAAPPAATPATPAAPAAPAVKAAAPAPAQAPAPVAAPAPQNQQVRPRPVITNAAPDDGPVVEAKPSLPAATLAEMEAGRAALERKK